MVLINAQINEMYFKLKAFKFDIIKKVKMVIFHFLFVIQYAPTTDNGLKIIHTVIP